MLRLPIGPKFLAGPVGVTFHVSDHLGEAGCGVALARSKGYSNEYDKH